MKKTMISLAIIAVNIPFAISSASGAPANITENSFHDYKGLENSHLNLNLHSAYYDQRQPKNEEGKSTDFSTMGTAVRLDFESGYFFDVVGLDWSGATGILNFQSGNKKESDNKFTPLKSNGKSRKYLSQLDTVLALKTQAKSDENHYIKAKAGYLFLDDAMIGSSTSKISPSTYRGGKLEAKLNNWDFYYDYINGIRNPSETKIHKLKNVSGKKLQFISESSVQWSNDALTAKLTQGHTHRYVDQYEGELNYKTPLSEDNSITYGSQLFYAKRGGKLWDVKKNGFKNNAWHGTLSVTYDQGPLSIGTAFSHTKAKGGQGIYQYSLADNIQDGYNSVTSLDEDFNYDGENAYQINTSYQLNDEFKASAIYQYGDQINFKKNKNIGVKRQQEVDFELVYTSKLIQGLELKAINYHVEQDNREKGRNNYNDFRIYANYKVAIF